MHLSRLTLKCVIAFYLVFILLLKCVDDLIILNYSQLFSIILNYSQLFPNHSGIIPEQHLLSKLSKLFPHNSRKPTLECNHSDKQANYICNSINQLAIANSFVCIIYYKQIATQLYSCLTTCMFSFRNLTKVIKKISKSMKRSKKFYTRQLDDAANQNYLAY